MGKNSLAPGIISRLEKDRGFGFIKCAGGYELYFHESSVQGTPFASLTQGQGAVYRIGTNQKGLQAIDVKPLNGKYGNAARKPENGPAKAQKAPETAKSK
jgi:cold shock CspA family protein